MPENDYHRIEKAIHYIEEHYKEQPSLDELAESANLSKFHFDRLFKKWAGISPLQFSHYLTLNYTKQKLAEAKSILDITYDAGLSGSGRLHDLYVNFEAMTPGEYKRQAEGLTITYGFGMSPFGHCLIAFTKRGICHLSFIKNETASQSVTQLESQWPKARFTENKEEAAKLIYKIFNIDQRKTEKPFHLFVKGTNFQINVWKALLRIPQGYLFSYQDVASYIGKSKAVRAVASSIAVNPVAFLIPCHRVIAKSGIIHKYRWGSTRKKAIIGWEAARRE